MGTIKRLNEARKAQTDAENAMPGAYQSQYKDRINETLDAMGGAGADSAVDTLLDKAYQQYRQQAGQNAAAAAQNAVDVTSGLSGGYGSNWAGNVAQQGYNEAMAAVDDAMPSLRAKALSQYQNQQNDLSDTLSALMNQESIAQNEYNGSVADAQNMRDYRQSRTNTATQENTSFWNNVWNTVKNVGASALNAYDTYKGFKQQKEEFEFEKKKYENAQRISDYSTAFDALKDGSPELADTILEPYGKDHTMFGDYNGSAMTREMYAQILEGAASLAAGGNDKAAKAYLAAYGLPEDSIDYYDDIQNRELDSYTKKQLFLNSLSGKSYSSGGSSYSRSSGSSSSSSTKTTNKYGYTNAQLLSMAKDFASMKESNPLYKHYKEVLTDAGMLEPETASSYKPTYVTVDGISGAQKPNNRNTGTTNQNASSSQQPLDRKQVAANAAKGQWEKGSDTQTIYNSLRLQGYSEEEIEYALNTLA